MVIIVVQDVILLHMKWVPLPLYWVTKNSEYAVQQSLQIRWMGDIALYFLSVPFKIPFYSRCIQDVFNMSEPVWVRIEFIGLVLNKLKSANKIHRMIITHCWMNALKWATFNVITILHATCIICQILRNLVQEIMSDELFIIVATSCFCYALHLIPAAIQHSSFILVR